MHADFEHAGVELATGRDYRPLAGHVARIEAFVERSGRRRIGEVDAVVRQRVVELEHCVVDQDRMGDQHHALDHGCETPRGIGLAGAGVTIEQDRAPRIQCGPEAIQQPLVDDHVRECAQHFLPRDAVRVHALARDHHRILFEGHWSGPDVAAARECFRCCAAALFAEAVAQLRLLAEAGTHLDARLGPGECEHAVEHRARDGEPGEQLAGREHARAGEVLEQQVAEKADRQPEPLGRERTRRELRELAQRCALRVVDLVAGLDFERQAGPRRHGFSSRRRAARRRA